jgi:hypothetical protein
MKRRTFHPAHRPMRLERCEARRMLSATAPNDSAFTETQAVLPTFVPWVQQSGWTPIDGDSSIVSVDYNAYRAELDQGFYDTTFTSPRGVVDYSGHSFVDTDFGGSLLEAGSYFPWQQDAQQFSFGVEQAATQGLPIFNFEFDGDFETIFPGTNVLRLHGFPTLDLPASNLGVVSELVFANGFGFIVTNAYDQEQLALPANDLGQNSETNANRQRPSWDLGSRYVIPVGAVDYSSAHGSPAFDYTTSDLGSTSDLGLGALELVDDPIEPPLLEPTDDSGPDLSNFSAPNESTSADPLLPLPTSNSPIERARPTTVQLERVSFVSPSAPDARALDAGMIDLAEVLFAPQHAAPVEPLAIEPDAPSLAARDAALAVESWVRTLPAPTDLPTAEASAAPGPDAAPIEVRTLPERPATEKLQPPRDRVSTAASKATTVDDAPASQPWEERLAQPYGFLAVSLTLLGGSVWASRRTGEDAGKNCIERPRRGPRTLD